MGKKILITYTEEKNFTPLQVKLSNLLIDMQISCYLPPIMINEFVDKVIVYVCDRKNRIQITQKIEIYINFIGEYKLLTMKEPAYRGRKGEVVKKEALKDKRHAQYLVHSADGRDANYNKHVAQQLEDRRKDDRKIYKQEYLITAKEREEDSEPIIVLQTYREHNFIR